MSYGKTLSEEIVSYLISKVKEATFIWNSKDPSYASKHTKVLFWNKLTREMNILFNPKTPITANEIAKKWNNLKSYYIQEQNKVQKMQENGSTENDIELVLNRWKYNKVLNFLTNPSSVPLAKASILEISNNEVDKNETSNDEIYKKLEKSYGKRKFTDDIIYFLLNKVEQASHIWDSEDPFYSSKVKKRLFWCYLAEEINKTFPGNLDFEAIEISKKWSNLKAYFQSEHQKVEKTEEYGTSSWKFYGAFKFLITPKEICNNKPLVFINLEKPITSEQSDKTDFQNLEVKTDLMSMAEEINAENFHNYCRLCMNKSKGSKYFFKDLQSSLLLLLEKCADLKNYSNSNFMCDQCYEKIKQFEKLCKLTKRTTLLLEKLAKNKSNINIEVLSGEETCENILTCPKIEPLISNNEEHLKDPLNYVNNSTKVVIKTELSEDCKETTAKNNIQTIETSLGNIEKLQGKFLSHTTLVQNETMSLDSSISTPYESNKLETLQEKPKIIAFKKYKYKQKPKPEVICEICGAIVKSQFYLKVHRLRHRPMEEWPLECEHCNKKFIDKANFKLHLLRHSGIKNFQCPHCGVKKVNARDLAVHINYHTKEKQFPCTYCKRVFNRKCRWKIHERVVHQKIKNHKCSFCGVQFAVPKTLREHELIHTGEKPHSCDICQQKFRKEIALKTHMKTHNKMNDSSMNKK